jgi:hypothetical protein
MGIKTTARAVARVAVPAVSDTATRHERPFVLEFVTVMISYTHAAPTR